MSQVPAQLSPSKNTVYGKHRIEALADGLFAIVMTLLVLELRIPDLPHSSSNAEIMHALVPLWRQLISFVLTFALASVFWMIQQSILSGTRFLCRVSMFLHLGAMLFVSLLPFSTAMLGHYGNKPVAQSLYFGNQAVIAALLFLAWARERRNHNTEISEYEGKMITVRTLSMVGVCTGAAIAGAIRPEWAILGVLPPVIATRLYRRRLKKQL